MNMGGLLRAVRRRLGWILLFAILAAGAASVYSLLQDEKYKATASLSPQPKSASQAVTSPSTTPGRTPERQAAMDMDLASRSAIARITRQELQRRGETEAADAVVSVEVQSHDQSDVIEVEATARDPRVAALVANTFAAEYAAFRRDADRANIQQTRRLVNRELSKLTASRQANGATGSVKSLNRRISSLRRQADNLRLLASLQTGNAIVVDRATPPSSPSSPKPVRDTILGGLAGLLLGVGAALLAVKMDRRLRDPEDLEEAFGLPVLARLPDSDALGRRLGMTRDLPPPEAEAFRMLRANLRYFEPDRDIDSVLITSASAQDGKSMVAFNLAAAAATQARVLLVEAEVRKPTLARSLGLPGGEGLTSVLSGEVPLSGACHEVLLMNGDDEGPMPTMDVLLAGDRRPDASELVESERMRDVLCECRRNYSLVVIDTPPAGLVSDAISLMSDVSAVIVVGRIGKLTTEQATRLRDQLEQIDAPTFGIVANFTDPDDGSYDLTGYELAGSSHSH
jgi:capsular exopolysaccharide synthesis family protein